MNLATYKSLLLKERINRIIFLIDKVLIRNHLIIKINKLQKDLILILQDHSLKMLHLVHGDKVTDKSINLLEISNKIMTNLKFKAKMIKNNKKLYKNHYRNKT